MVIKKPKKSKLFKDVIVEYDPELNKYDGKPLFPEHHARMKKMLEDNMESLMKIMKEVEEREQKQKDSRKK